MTDQEGPDDEVGTAADEAAKLLDAVAGWAREHGGGAGWGEAVGAWAHGFDEHHAGDAEECRWCPLCRAVRVLRSASPEVRQHLTAALGSLAQAATAMLATPPPGREGVEHIDLTVDVGGTKILGGVVDESGTVVEELRVVSPATDVVAIVSAITSLVGGLASRHQVSAVGVGAAGYIDKSRSVVMFAPNLAWRDFDLRAALESHVSLPVVIENDANAAAWGEFRFGAGEDVDDLLLVTVGTGVGGGVVVDGRLHRGGFGVGGEIGHMRVVPGGIRCGCGNLGCLESYASGTALVREARAAAAGGAAPVRPLLHLAGGDPAAITGPMVTDLAQRGDAFCRSLLTGLGTWLGEGIASLAAVLDPAVVVVGGGVGAAGNLLLDPVRAAFGQQLTGRGHRPLAEVRSATLGNRAGVIGAADLAREPRGSRS
jgi:glucokinase